MTNKQAFATTLAMLGATYDKKLTGPAVEGYWLVLSDLTETEFGAATKRALAASKFMPTPSELLAFAGHQPRDLAAEATLAWDAVRQAMDGLDVYGNPDFGPLVNAVVRNLGGWVYLCESKLSDLEWRRKDFERVFRMWAEKDPSILPDGGPLFGQWKNAPVTRVQIAGLPVQPLALPAQKTATQEAVIDVVRQLADAKALAGAAAPELGVVGGVQSGRIPGRPLAADDVSPPASPPPRETIPKRPEKAKAPRMSEAEVDARKRDIAAQMAARGVTLPVAAEGVAS